jgi:hypothetical protein
MKMESSGAPWQPLEPPWQPLGAPLVALRPSRWDLTCDLPATYLQLTCNLLDFGQKRPRFLVAFSSFFRPSIFDQSFDVILDRFGVPKRVQNGSKIDFEIGALIVRRSEYFLEGT